MKRSLCVVVFVFAFVFGPGASMASAQSFTVLSGTAVTCSTSAVTGDVGVWPGTAITNTGCTIVGTVHSADAAAQTAFMNFAAAYANLRDHPPACVAPATATLAEALMPGVYCTNATAKTGPLILDAGGNPSATWLFLVDGALTGTNFSVTMINGGNPCNVVWWVRAAATMTTSTLKGNVLAGAAITVTGGTFSGNALAIAGVTLTNTVVKGCATVGGVLPPTDKCEVEDHDKDHDGDHDGDHDHDKDGKDKDHKDNDRDHRDDKDKKDGKKS